MKYYGVHAGRVTGVFQDWNNVEKFVKGYSGAKYKAFDNSADARYFYVTGESPQTSSRINCLTNTLLSGKDEVKEKKSVEKEKTHDSFAFTSAEFCTDGSCQNSRGGYGFVEVFPDGKFVGRKGFVPYNPCTNNIAELYAIKMALERSQDQGLTRVKIYSDSEYSVNIFEKWLEGWKQAGWKRANGNGQIENLELIREIDNLIKEQKGSASQKVSASQNITQDIKPSSQTSIRPSVKPVRAKVTFHHVRGHNGHPLNEMADKLAKAGVLMGLEAIL